MKGFKVSISSTTVHLNVNIDPTAITASQAGEYILALVAKLTSDLSAMPPSLPGSAAHIVGIDSQLARLMDHNPAFAVRVRTLHNNLEGLGYVPTLPNSKKDPLPSYISYLDTITGRNLGNLNSERFTVMRGALRDRLNDQPHFSADDRYAHCQLTSDEAVRAVTMVAKDEKAVPND